MDAVKNLKYQASNYTEDRKKGELETSLSEREAERALVRIMIA